MATATAKQHSHGKMDFEPESADKNSGETAITVSKTTYAALTALKKAVDDANGDFVPFVQGNWTNGQVITEATKKGILQKKGSHKSAL